MNSVNKIFQNIIKKYSSIVLYIIEFISSFFVAFLSLKICAGADVQKSIFIIIPVFILFVISFILNIIVNRNILEKIWIICLIPIGMLFLVYIIPTYGPDENAHLWKAYELSEGIFITKINADSSYTTNIPKFYEDNVYPNILNYKDMIEKMDNETNYKDTTKITNPASGYFSPFYCFSAIGLFIGRTLKMNGFYTEYLARLFNYAVFLIIGYYSIKKIPIGKVALGVIMFFPMCLQQGTSMSIDCLLIALSFFYISYTLYLKYKEEIITKNEKIMYCIVSILIAIAKYVYLPICCLSLLLISKKNLSKKEKLFFVIGTIIVPLIIALVWFKISSRYEDTRYYLVENNVNFGKQLEFALNNPLKFTKVILKNFVMSFKNYIFGAVGQSLGWLAIHISSKRILVFLSMLVLAIYIENNSFQLNYREAIYLILITIGVFLLTIIAMYLGWTGIGKEEVDGVQGRYFVPVLILPCLCLARRNWYVKYKSLKYIIILVVMILNLTVIKSIFTFFV